MICLYLEANGPICYLLPGLIRPHPVDRPWARWAYRMRISSFHYCIWGAIWWLIIQTFFELPTWCLKDPDICNPDSEISAYYPR